jgi:broad specificity phosphatase PhoE
MEVYLIRHAETGGNLAHRHQALKTPLTPLGRQQALTLAHEVCDLQPTHVLSSPLVRALDTARIIGAECDIVPEVSQYFAELDRPAHLYGNFHISPASLYYYINWYLGRTTVGESYAMLRDRIASAQSHFLNYPEDARIAVVTHSVFINMFVAHLCHHKPMGFFTAVRTFTGILTTKNTELVPLIFNPDASTDTCGWFRIE